MAVKNKTNAANLPVAPAAIPPSATTERLERIGSSLEGKGRLILYILGALIALAVVASLIYMWQSRAAQAAQTALGRAIETQEAQVSASPIPGSTAPVFTTEKERAEKALAQFDEVAKNYGSPYREKAQYFAALNRLKLDRAAGLQDLQNLTGISDTETATLAKFALAEANAADGKYDEAAALYSDLAKQPNRVLPIETINFALASVYEKQGKTAEAADVYFNLAKNAREAKDADGKPTILTATARQAAERLEKLDSTKFASLPPEPSPAGL